MTNRDIKKHPKYIEFMKQLNKERQNRLDLFGIELRLHTDAKHSELMKLIEEIKKED